MLFRITPSSGVPVYLQIMEQVRYAVETGALRPGEKLPTIRNLARDLVINPNTVVRAYRDLEHEGVVELRQGSGAFISKNVEERSSEMLQGRGVVRTALQQLEALGLHEEKMRRLIENELSALRAGKSGGNGE